MASVRKLGSTQTIEVQGNKVTVVKEYRRIAVASLPEGGTAEIYYQFRRPKAIDAATIASVSQQFADRIEGVMNLPDVHDVVYSQDTTLGGRLQDRMTTYWRTADGLFEGDVEQALRDLGPTVTGALVAQEIADAQGF